MFGSLKKLVGIETTTEKEVQQTREAQKAQEAREVQEAKWREEARRAGVNPDLVTTLTGHTGGVWALTVLRDSRLVSGSSDRTIKVWTVPGEQCALTLTGHMDVVWALTVLGDGRLVSGSRDKTIKVWSVSGRQCELTLMGHTNWVRALAVLGDGRLASGSDDRTIKVWSVSERQCELTLTGHTGSVLALTILGDGRLASGSWDHTIKVWTVSGEQCELTLTGHTDSVLALTVLRDGRLVSGSADKTIKVWAVSGGQCELTLSEHTHSVSALTVLGDGRLASGSWDKTIKVWTASRGQSEFTLTGYTRAVSALTVLGDGRLASGSWDHTIKAIGVSAAHPGRQEISDEKMPADAGEDQRERERLQLTAEVEALRAKLAEVEKIGKDENNNVDANVTLPGVLYIPEQKVTLGEELGRGGFGTVYRGQYNYQTVAVKRYEGARLPARQQEEILHEVGIMLRLQHECLVRLLGLVEVNHSPAMMVMEFGANGSLYHYLQSLTEMPWGLRLRMAEELARGLAYLHEEKIIHRDIKSLNVVLDKDLHAKWCDFGLAALKLHTTTTTTQEATSPVGALRWMAPELFVRKTSSPSTASDVWALGMVFFELASRKIPFEEARDNDQVKDFIKEATGEEVPAECEQASPGFASIMRRCWLERTQRPTAADLARELSQLSPAKKTP